MTIVWIILALAAALIAAAALFAWLLRRAGTPEERSLVRRVLRLPLRGKLRLALALVREPRVPLLVRALPPALVLYLAMPLDIIPDFVPVIGHLDDALVLLIGIALVLRFTPRGVLEEQVERL
ncbi:MAG TPA: DUF1232 domain-containing protein, partial [Dehalococcoidia bacterium]|nr:DUF1232 domain-containing protein [Dehalococcoidia bacterium]